MYIYNKSRPGFLALEIVCVETEWWYIQTLKMQANTWVTQLDFDLSTP